jgi:hypothetical protein
MTCSHGDIHDAVTLFDRNTGELVYTRVCGKCGQRLDVMLREAYRPSFDPHGNDRYLSPQLSNAGAPAATP